jgi:hypothetical protein
MFVAPLALDYIELLKNKKVPAVTDTLKNSPR